MQNESGGLFVLCLIIIDFIRFRDFFMLFLYMEVLIIILAFTAPEMGSEMRFIMFVSGFVCKCWIFKAEKIKSVFRFY